MSVKRGRMAARSGLYGEDVAEALISQVLPICSFSDWNETIVFPIAVKQYPTPHPYRPEKKRAGKNDFMLFGFDGFRIFMQVKNQEVGGTTDEKLSFTFDIARFAITDTPYSEYWLVLLGKYWATQPGLLEYCQRKCREFEMLIDGTRRNVSARVIVGPIELAHCLNNQTMLDTNR